MLMDKMDGHFSPGFSSLQCWTSQEWLIVQMGNTIDPIMVAVAWDALYGTTP
jgi:hypothetical protein